MSDHDYLSGEDRRHVPQPLTEDQLLFFTQQTDRAVHKAVRKFRNGAIVGFMILLVGLGASNRAQVHDQQTARNAIIKSGTVVAIDGCNGRFNDRQSLRAVFQRLQTAVRDQAAAGKTSAADAEVAIKFYQGELDKLKLPDCRPTAHILTDAPYPPVKLPTPLHP